MWVILSQWNFLSHFFLDYAWKPDNMVANDLLPYTEQWAAKQFGNNYAKDIADIISNYLQYNSRRKPELLSPDTYSLINYREGDRIVEEYSKLLAKADKH